MEKMTYRTKKKKKVLLVFGNKFNNIDLGNRGFFFLKKINIFYEIQSFIWTYRKLDHIMTVHFSISQRSILSTENV